MGLVDGLDRPQPHGHGGKLPEIRHQPGMRVGGQALAIHFPTKVVQLLFADAPFQVSAGIHPRRGMALEKHQVPFVFIAGGPEEMIESHIVKSGGGRKGGNMAPQFVVIHVSPHHRGQGIPAHQRTHPAFHENITGNRNFVLGGNGIEVRGIEVGSVDALFLGLIGDGIQ